jgi:N-acyl-D-amino-acid deacylase
MLDVRIRGGLVVDGARAPRECDVGIQGDRISAIGKGLGRARRSIEATGKVVVPGFIDMHTHSDFTIPIRPSAEAKLLQGITTDVTGNCGFSPFPLSGQDGDRHHGEFFEPELSERWPSFAAFADDVGAIGLGVNLAPLVGLGAVRLAVLGEANVRADERALAEMGTRLRQALREGAFGASSGLVYAPSSFADTSELRALAAIVADEGGIYATHIRDEGEKLLDAIEEAIDVSRSSGCRLQISHLKALGRAQWGSIAAVLERIDQANNDGSDVWADFYPYTAGSTSLASLLPAAALDGGEEAFARRLLDEHERSRLTRALEHNSSFALDDVVLAAVPGHPELGGRRVSELAASDGLGLAEVVLRLLERNGTRASMVAFGMAESDVEAVVSHPRTLFGSDGWTMTVDAVPYAHPRNFASSIRLLSRYVRDRRSLDLSQAVAKLAYLPSRRLGLLERGQICTGAIADVVVLDLEQLSEESTFEAPCRYPRGIDYVFLAGEAAVENGHATGARAGRVLRRASGGEVA